MHQACLPSPGRTIRGRLRWASAPLLAAGCVAVGSFSSGCGSRTAPAPATGSPPPVAAAPTAPEADEDGQVATRNIIRKSLPPDSVSMILEYTVMLPDANGNETPVDPHEHVFKIGDEIAVRIKPDDDVYVYVFNKGPTGTLTILLPTDGEQPPRVAKGQEISLPEADFFQFAPPAGKEELLVVATYEPSDNVRLLARNTFAAQAGKQDGGLESKSDGEGSAAKAALDNLTSGVVTRGTSPKLSGKAPARAKTHVFPPEPGSPSNLAVTYGAAGAGKPEMILSIPLVSRAGDDAGAAPAP